MSAEERPMISVDAVALWKLLVAVNGPAHWIREMQATRTPPIGDDNPINIIMDQYNAWIRMTQALQG